MITIYLKKQLAAKIHSVQNMFINRSYGMDKVDAVHALEEVADRFLKKEYQGKVTFMGLINKEDPPMGSIERLDRYWYGGDMQEMISVAFQMVGGINAGILEAILSAAHTINATGLCYNTGPTHRFSIRQLAEAHAPLLDFSQRGFNETFEVTPDDGWWHLGIGYIPKESNTGIMQIHFANNYSDEPTPGFERLYWLLFDKILDRFTRRGV